MRDIPKIIPIKKVIKETDHVKTFVFEHDLGGRPGQFVNVWIPRVNEKPMSIAYCDKKEFWLSVFAVGEFSRKLHDFKAGGLVGIRGPYGKGFTFKPRRRLIMMAGGYGAAPLYFLAVEAAGKGCMIDFVAGARSKEHLLYLSRLKKLKGVTVHVATDDGSAGVKGYNTVILQKLIEEAQKVRGKKGGVRGNGGGKGAKIDCVYACGPEMMMKKVSDMCFAAGLSAQLSIERYMKCGFGVCGQCCVDGTGEPMCTKGPVVSNEYARKILEFGKYHRDSLGRIHQF